MKRCFENKSVNRLAQALNGNCRSDEAVWIALSVEIQIFSPRYFELDPGFASRCEGLPHGLFCIPCPRSVRQKQVIALVYIPKTDLLPYP